MVGMPGAMPQFALATRLPADPGFTPEHAAKQMHHKKATICDESDSDEQGE